jgi:hypothetical protein
VIVVSGDIGRQAFFSAKGFDLTEGFKMLSGAVRDVLFIDKHALHECLFITDSNGPWSDFRPTNQADCSDTQTSWIRPEERKTEFS